MKIIRSNQQVIKEIKKNIIKVFQEFVKHPILSMIGGLFIGIGIPIGSCIFSPFIDLSFLFFGIIILSINYYYIFVYKNN